MTNVFSKIGRKVWGQISDKRFIKKSELYRYWEQFHLERLLSTYAVDCVFDVGANYGQYATMLRQECGFQGLIFSFEPFPDAIAHLNEISQNDRQWIINDIALSDSEEAAEFKIMEGNQFSSLSNPVHEETDLFLERNRVNHTIQVHTRLLSTVFEQLQKEYGFERPFLKLDTQGFDVRIIRGSENIINSFVAIQSELSIKRIYADSSSFCDAINYYQSLGFTLSAFVPNNAGHFPRLIETDCILINDSMIN